MSAPRQAPSSDAARTALADRLHSAAIHLLRKLRAQDTASGLSGPRLSALSVIVFGGPITVSALADAEQVRPPTISRMVKELEAGGLVERLAHPADARVHRIRATAAGRALLERGRSRRVGALAAELEALSPVEARTLAEAATILERMLLPPDHPGREDI
jgi:DNA-binding MarR family transcriptional regulator